MYLSRTKALQGGASILILLLLTLHFVKSRSPAGGFLGFDGKGAVFHGNLPLAAEAPRSELEFKEGRMVRRSTGDLFSGWAVEAYPDGSRQSRCMVSNGVLNGLSLGWHTNGVVAIREWFVNGRSEGVRTRWDDKGRRYSESEVKDGVLNGLHRVWHTNGQMACEMVFVSGKGNGVARRWNSNGMLTGTWTLSEGAVVAVNHSAETTELVRVSKGASQ